MKLESRKSTLWPYLLDIEQMRKEGITYQLIKDWLKQNGVDTSIQNIRQFYLRSENKGKNSEAGKPKIKKKISVFANLKTDEDGIL